MSGSPIIQTPAGRKPLFDPVAVTDAINLIVGDGSVVEVRLLDATTASDRWPATYSGYFNDAGKIASALRSVASATGFYFTLNPVDPALLARANNRLRKTPKGESTADSNITRRLWLPVDCDAERPSGISASDAEHEAALARADEISEHLTGLGWPKPIVADSGNGGHLLYRIDLAADDEGLVNRCLETLSERFSDDVVKIDCKVFNPARIWKLYGSLACKGDDTTERPHRMAKIINRPATVEVVDSDLLGGLAGDSAGAVSTQAKPQSHASHDGDFDLVAFIARHGLEVNGPTDWQGRQGRGKTWALKSSPMCDHHDDGPHLIQHASGAVTAGCHHDSCSWKWADLRRKFEPGYGDNLATYGPVPVSTPVGAKLTDNGEKLEPWPETIDRLEDDPLPAFPTSALPPVLRAWVEAESHATQTPVDLPALLALAVCGAALARRVTVEPRHGFQEPVNLFVAVVLGPANRKSAVFADATKPLEEIEGELIDAATPLIAHAQSERRQDIARMNKLEKLWADKADHQAKQEAAELSEQIALSPLPVLPRLLVGDATSQKIEIMLKEQGGRLASMSAEGEVFDMMAGKCNKGEVDFNVYLKGHAGDKLKTDRVSREDVRVDRPALTCAYTIQPQVLSDLAGKRAFRGRGLLARFMYALPSSRIGRREIGAPAVSDSIKLAYRDLIRRLHSEAESSDEVVLTFTPAADATLRAWEVEIEAALAEGGELEAIEDWGGKLAGATVRIAAILHAAEFSIGDQVEAESVEAAVEIAKYLIPHSMAALDLQAAQQDTAREDAKYLLRWIERHQLSEFTKRKAHQHGKARFPKAAQLDAGLFKLASRGYIRHLPEPKSPGRPSIRYQVNQQAIELEIAERPSQYSQKPLQTPESGSSGNSGSAPEGCESSPSTASQISEAVRL